MAVVAVAAPVAQRGTLPFETKTARISSSIHSHMNRGWTATIGQLGRAPQEHIRCVLLTSILMTPCGLRIRICHGGIENANTVLSFRDRPMAACRRQQGRNHSYTLLSQTCALQLEHLLGTLSLVCGEMWPENLQAPRINPNLARRQGKNSCSNIYDILI